MVCARCDTVEFVLCIAVAMHLECDQQEVLLMHLVKCLYWLNAIVTTADAPNCIFLSTTNWKPWVVWFM